MKKNNIFRFGSILVAFVILISCQKEIQEPEEANNVSLKSASIPQGKSGLKLLANEGLNDGFLQSYHYNGSGLADEFNISKPDQYSFWATMGYDSRNRMSNARFYYSTEDFYDIVFSYDKDKLVKETWYSPGTEIVVDQYMNTYNKKGQLIKRDDPPYELYTMFQYDNKGNCTRLEIFDYQGNLYYGIEFSYRGPIKNPFASVTGLPVSVFFLDDITGPYRFTGIKYYFNDENGNRVVYFNWESEETEITVGPQHYPTYQKSHDIISDTWTAQTWTYEKFDGKSESHQHLTANPGHNSGQNSHKMSKFRAKSFRQDMKEIRANYANNEK